MDFKFYLPGKESGVINFIWEQRAEEPEQWQILPSGCLELIFRMGPALDDFNASQMDRSSDPTNNICFLSGLHTRPLYMHYTSFHFMGIQLEPVAVQALFGIPCKELKDGALDGDQLFKCTTQIEEKLNTLSSFEERCKWLEEYVWGFINETADLKSALKLQDIIEKKLIRSDPSNFSLENITGYSRTHTHRLFKKWFGQSAHEYVMMQNFLMALRQIHFTDQSLTSIAHDMGYYDQPHFNRIFKRYTKMTPGEYRRRKSEVPGQLPW